jgi:hypothetical protein
MGLAKFYDEKTRLISVLIVIIIEQKNHLLNGLRNETLIQNT